MNKKVILLLLMQIIVSLLSAQHKNETPYSIFGDNTPVLEKTTPQESSECILIVFSNDSTISIGNSNPNELILKNIDGDTLAIYSINASDYATFTTPDPKYSEMPGFSHYSFCYGNPLNFIDIDGKRPEPQEAALMAQLVYGDFKYRNEFLLENAGWKESEIHESLGISLSSGGILGNGLNSTIFERSVNGVKEYAYVFAGTTSLRDAEQDLSQLAGISGQYRTAINNAKKFADALSGNEVTFIGHSLGGGEAAAASMATGHAAITFNPAAVSPLTKLFNGLDASNANITNFITVSKNSKWGGCLINKFQDAMGMSAPGTRVEIPITTQDPLKAHSIGIIVDHLLNEGK